MPLFHTLRPLVLASRSPRRRRFLADAGLEYAVAQENGSAEEPRPAPGETPLDYVLRAARAKALATPPPANKNSAVLAADTIVALDAAILGKPEDEREALRMLQSLCGRTHTVLTAVCLRDFSDGSEALFADLALVHFADWPEEVLRAYAASGDCFDKAGAYGIQGMGCFLSDRIEGSWDTVAGLPVGKTLRLLLERRVIAPWEGNETENMKNIRATESFA